jgi:RNA polymerase sigma-70 factor (ECF subfamily)
MANAHQPAGQPAEDKWQLIEAFVQPFEQAWQRGGRPEIDDFLPQDSPDRLAVLKELVRVDIERRRSAGEVAEVEGYVKRYPELTPCASESTCWTMIRAAAAGSRADRDELARRYLGIVRAYLAARWRGTRKRSDLDDAVQEVFVECFRQGGALATAEAGRVPRFRAFLYGVARNVARRFECLPVSPSAAVPDVPANETDLSQLFERSWAQAIMSEAARLQRRRAEERGPEAVRRIELLRLRFEENLPIRTIAERWGVPAAELHHAYALARQEFKAALLEVVAFHQPGTRAEVDQEAASLLKALA